MNIKTTLIENEDGFKDRKDPYGLPQTEHLKLDNLNMLKKIEEIGNIAFKTNPDLLNNSIYKCILQL